MLKRRNREIPRTARGKRELDDTENEKRSGRGFGRPATKDRGHLHTNRREEIESGTRTKEEDETLRGLRKISSSSGGCLDCSRLGVHPLTGCT